MKWEENAVCSYRYYECRNLYHENAEKVLCSFIGSLWPVQTENESSSLRARNHHDRRRRRRPTEEDNTQCGKGPRRKRQKSLYPRTHRKKVSGAWKRLDWWSMPRRFILFFFRFVRGIKREGSTFFICIFRCRLYFDSAVFGFDLLTVSVAAFVWVYNSKFQFLVSRNNQQPFLMTA